MFLLAYKTTREIADYAQLTERTAQRALKRLIDAGLIRRVMGGSYGCYGVQYQTPEYKRAVAELHAEAWNRADASEQPELH